MRCKTLLLTFILAAMPLLSGTAIAANKSTSAQELGKLLYFDTSLSSQSQDGSIPIGCVSCHSPDAGFADPRKNSPVSLGSEPGTFGLRNAQTAAYAAYTPPFHRDDLHKVYVGGQFWDGRADTVAEQAFFPLINPFEHGFTQKHEVFNAIKASPDSEQYYQLFKTAYGLDLGLVPDVAPQPGTEEEAFLDAAYAYVATAIGEFEKTSYFNRFNSKFDLYVSMLIAKLRKTDITAADYLSTNFRGYLTSKEFQGLRLFVGKAGCARCHPADTATAPGGSFVPPLFTNWEYHNIGLPNNPVIFYPPGLGKDVGLGGFLRFGANALTTETGKFKAMTLRNIALTSPYGHNGYFGSLEDMVSFMSDRSAFVPETSENLSPYVGSLYLTPTEQSAIVAFLKTLSDGEEKLTSPYILTLAFMY